MRLEGALVSRSGRGFTEMSVMLISSPSCELRGAPPSIPKAMAHPRCQKFYDARLVPVQAQSLGPSPGCLLSLADRQTDRQHRIVLPHWNSGAHSEPGRSEPGWARFSEPGRVPSPTAGGGPGFPTAALCTSRGSRSLLQAPRPHLRPGGECCYFLGLMERSRLGK